MATNVCKCDFDTQMAYITENKTDTPRNQITIVEFLKDKTLHEKLKRGNIRLVCKENNELIKYESEIRRSHFKHKNFLYNDMSEWHREWQSHFENQEVAIGNRFADAVVDNKVLEFQHSRIPKEVITARTKNYKEHNKELYWVLDCNDSLEINEVENNRYMIEFKKDSIWKYENFIGVEYIYLNIDDRLFRINPDRVKSHQIDVNEYKMKSDFIDSLHMNISIWNTDELTQCVLYHNQRGAGCGKTYESIQLLQNSDTFRHKTVFIYLTKMHSAKEVIYNEFKEQLKDKKLNSIKIDSEEEGNQYKISYTNTDTNNECHIIIGTIDSFMYAIGDKNVKDKDVFFGIVKSIKNGYVDTGKDGSIKYAKKNIKINKHCLIIIDEAQDLSPEYIAATASIMRTTYTDTYVIGDKLQSIWGENNIHTFLEKNDLPTITIKRNDGVNQVKRFHNTQFKDFVNRVVDFNKYNLISIDGICQGGCKYEHENHISPYTLFEAPPIYSDESDDNKVNNVIEKIISYMNLEIDKYNYLPNNFMFIFPTISKNFLANRLESRLQDFWIKRYNDSLYQDKVLKKDKYWGDKLNNDAFYKYVYLHKSDEGKSINLKESENASRMLSVHASKGSGCEVVFLLGLSEQTLRLFSKDKNNLQYDSLLHVALTRQKKSIYIGLERNGDDICERFKFCELVKDLTIKPNLNDIKKSDKYEKTIDWSFENNYESINEAIIKLQDYDDLIPENNANKCIIDWGHHTIRYSVFWYYILYYIINNEKMDDNSDENAKLDQFKTLLNKISKLEITYYIYKDYYRKLKDKKTKEVELPILYFESNERSKYTKYKTVLSDFIRNIQNKIQTSLKEKELPYLCALETVILQYMIKINDDGIYSDITIMDVYSIMYCYDECSNSIDDSHTQKYKCSCRKHFVEGNKNTDFLTYQEIRASIKNHYDKIKQLEKVYQNYKEYIMENLKDSSSFKYNINHPIPLAEENANFKIFNKHTIIANSDKYVLDFIIKPQFNKLNINRVICEGLFHNFLLLNCDPKQNNYKRFSEKKIITCIFTLDSDKPIFIDFNILKENPTLKDSIKKYIINKYSEKHDKIYDYYFYCKENKPKNIDSITYTLNEITANYDSIPKYIENYFYDIKKELDSNKKNNTNINNVLSKVNNKAVFLEKIGLYLEDVVNDFLKNKVEEPTDCDY